MRIRDFMAGVLLSVGIGVALLGLHFVLDWPISHYRARLIFMLWSGPLQVGGFYLAVLLTAGILGAYITGWRSPATYWGALGGALLVLVALYLNLFSYYVWIYEHEVTSSGRRGRLLLATALLGITLATGRWARRITQTRATRRVVPGS